tara:strand:+ start:1944 stop:2759 length:816 start_codon:yes stop_codon:yes gene_type:complete
MAIKEPTINKVLHSIQKNLKAPKSQVNKFGGFNYRSCEDIVEAVKKLLPDDYYLTLTDNLVQIGDRYYIHAVAKLSNEKDYIITSSFAREAEIKKGMDVAQITGATSSYARKYALNGLFGIDDTKDADHDSLTEPLAKKEVKQTKQTVKLTGSKTYACPKCKKTKPVIENKFKKGHLTCWKNHDDKGCGFVWIPGVYKDDIPVHKPTNEKEALYVAIEAAVQHLKVGSDFIKMRQLISKKSYPVDWSLQQMTALQKAIIEEYAESNDEEQI